MKYCYFLVLTILISSCSSPIQEVMKSDHPAIKQVAKNLKNHEVQIIFTQIDSTDNGSIEFTDHAFQVNEKDYFYPASTVKLPVALLAVEKLATDSLLHLDILYKSERDDELHNVAGDLLQIFAVSDNEAYNRLYEYMGRDYINDRLREKGLAPTRIAHRLSTSNADEAQTAQLKFFPSYEGDIVLEGNIKDGSIAKIKVKRTEKGVGYMKDSLLVNAPMDFSSKNYFPLEAQHGVMQRLFFPEQFKEEERFQIPSEDLVRIKQMMRSVPRQAGYDEVDYYDSYVKFFMYGDTKERIPEHIKMYNKVGYAYGTLTETAYIVDEKENVQFLLSATILVNENGIFNDNTYEYETVGIPFLAQLGREFHQYAIGNK
ncbi:hypothetical protein EAX61_07795 [Dokdonia sinensis]|uniref:Beta-lactamase class A catalytic domain-containing protein n=1 Tax=Dokdonia sinensis TaxID=2479847 RepID=A0A3M0GEA1_9FLAO|nr:serine hydrolase [Dokdonia sinensis]RMB59479.1 hypothetical protein EAX61_07795 [Dokdonia sinensis]